MASAALNHQPPSLDAFAAPYQIKQQQTYADFSPAALYGSLDDFGGTDFTTDSAGSPGSPLSPVLGNYRLPSQDGWLNWEKVDQSSEPDQYFKPEPYESPALSSIPARVLSLSPSINPMELANALPDDVAFGREGMNDTQPLFQSPHATSPTAAAQPASSSRLAATTASAGNPPLSDARFQAEVRRYPARNLKRKSSSPTSSTPSSPSSSPSPPPLQRRHTAPTREPILPPKKTAHNMIEKRYRTNLNDKIAALRDSVPALRVMVHRLEHTHSGEDDDVPASHGFEVGEEEEDLGGLTPAHKLNKATILGKATEYIAHLERRNRSLAKENAALRSRVEGFEMLVMSRGGARGVWN
ncbi:Sterol regulatory element-binding protein 1 [Pleurostoma richardsiae]|uniref:Sterol regulatory element-binding protein 1 n=1 Tax=Pleurostoma richardsiae TaxID=41990 RepID=A0AA38R185_9PEZI|nr:Sterol regulatory element-binding protein 1 [Pleurostoma richardsiae]